MTVPVKPVVKWVGGKGRILEELLTRLPNNYVFYYEVFGGGAALRLALPLKRYSVVADANHNLIQTYSMIVSDCTSVSAGLVNYRDEYLEGSMQTREAMYYRIRDEFRQDAPCWQDGPLQAARFLFLNRTGYNGLYRENQSGEYNVPFGHNERPAIVPESLHEFSQALTGTKLMHGDFRKFMVAPKGGDFLYLDPPYDGTYSSYTGRGFGDADLQDLGGHCKRFDQMGVYWMLSNSDTLFVREVSKGFRIETIMAPRSVSREGSGRKMVQELIIRNY